MVFWLLIHHQFCRVQGLLDLFRQKSMTYTWPTLTLPPACTESKLLQCKLLKIAVFSWEGLQARFAVPTEIHCGFTIDHQRSKRTISSLWKQILSNNLLFFFFCSMCMTLHQIYWNNSVFLNYYILLHIFIQRKFALFQPPLCLLALILSLSRLATRSEIPAQSDSQLYILLPGIKA